MKRIATKTAVACAFLGAGLVCLGLDIGAAERKAAGEAAIDRIEARWGGVMTKIRGWNADAMRQFREGYREYPPEILETALAARTFEKMLDILDAHATVRAQDSMMKAVNAHAIGATTPEDAANEQLVEAKQLVAKALGDDARDLVFIPITPCTVWDTRFATNPDSAGIIDNAATKRFYSHLDGAGGSYAAYGGNPSCPETAQNSIGFRPFAVMMTVYINDPTGNGWLTLYRDGDPDPSFATISVYYSPGPTRTQTVISKSSRGYGTGTYDVAATSRFANTHASASITGYFVKVDETGTVSSVTAAAPLTSSGGNTPEISLTGTIAVANGGTGQSSLASNGVVYGQGTSAVGAAVGAAGQVLAGNAGAPAFTGSPTLSGNLTLTTPSTASVGSIMKGATRFIHNAGTFNTSVGFNAGSFTLTGNSNSAFGYFALPNVTSAFNVTAIGTNAAESVTSGSNNTALGAASLLFTTSGGGNTALGRGALQNNTTGVGNIGIGSSGGGLLTVGSFNIAIGNAGNAAETHTIRIGIGGTQTKAFIAGIRGTSTDVGDAIPVLIDSSGQLGTVSSSRRFKDEIADMDADSSALMNLRPVTFRYKAEQSRSRKQYGLIAEEVAQVYPGLVAQTSGGEVETVMYQFLAPMMLNEMQKQQRSIEELKAQVARLLEERTGGR